MSIRILVADDHAILRAGLCALLNAEPGMEVVGEAADGHEALRLAGELHPDVVLLDVQMPGLDGIEATRQLKETMPGACVLILTLHDEAGLLREAIRAGAAGYIVKMAPASDLVEAIHTVIRGEPYIHPALTTAVVQALVGDSPGDLLTPREIEVLRLVAQGYTNPQIAGMFRISKRTVEFHLRNLKRKLGLRKHAELMHYAMEHEHILLE